MRVAMAAATSIRDRDRGQGKGKRQKSKTQRSGPNKAGNANDEDSAETERHGVEDAIIRGRFLVYESDLQQITPRDGAVWRTQKVG
jgi:hypothetical protein